MQFSCNNDGNCGSTENNFSSTLHLESITLSYTANGINEPTEEKHVSGGTDERNGWICWL